MGGARASDRPRVRRSGGAIVAAPLGGKVAAVTGGADGIGAAVVRRLAALGADVALLVRTRERAAPVAAEVEAQGRRAHVVAIDLETSADIEPAVANVLAAFCRIDILVNCAANTGTTKPNTLLELAEREWDRIYAINVKAPFLLMQHVGRHMVARGGGGRIVNVTTAGAFRARAVPAYGSSKAALTQLARTAAAELGPHAITVNNVAPAITRTPAAVDLLGGERLREIVGGDGTMSNLLGRVAEPEDVASAVAYLCLPEALHITAQTLHVDGGHAL